MERLLLPDEFSDLEPFAGDWALRTERERYAKRTACTLEELQTFYDAAFPRMEAAIKWLNQFELSTMSDGQKRLMWLFYSLINVSFAVEIWRQPRVPDTGSATMPVVEDPSV